MNGITQRQESIKKNSKEEVGQIQWSSFFVTLLAKKIIGGNERKIVFWYDDDTAYAEEIDGIQLEEGCKLHKLTGKNDFATKLLLEHQDLTTNYLPYAPYARPEDKENSLVDIFYYAEHFSSDKLNQLMEDMGIPVEYQDEVRRYKKFQTSGNLTKFKALQISEYTPGYGRIGNSLCTSWSKDVKCGGIGS